MMRSAILGGLTSLVSLRVADLWLLLNPLIPKSSVPKVLICFSGNDIMLGCTSLPFIVEEKAVSWLFKADSYVVRVFCLPQR